MTRLAVFLLLLVSLVGCVHRDETLVLVGGQPIDSARIDSDPIGLLPKGALMIGRVDARSLFAGALGSSTAALVAAVLPLGRESNFDPSRDVTVAYGAFYAMQGADFCAVLQGGFDVASIERAATLRSTTPSGSPLTRTRYGGYAMYTVGNVGFVILTPHTILSGDETGMRRALDRLRYGHLEHALEPWMEKTLGEPGAPMALVGDLAQQGVVLAAADRLPFLSGIVRVRALGNFKSPGVNVVGTLTYADAESASRGAASLGEARDLAAMASFLTTWGGASPPALEVKSIERDVSFASSVDTAFMQFVLTTLAHAFRPVASAWMGG